jgi:hypothetical protein
MSHLVLLCVAHAPNGKSSWDSRYASFPAGGDGYVWNKEADNSHSELSGWTVMPRGGI